ncbi:MAG TPA: hypothetical protein VGK00_08435 [Anaerolineales bacterium]|jgi:hypothetical protein
MATERFDTLHHGVWTGTMYSEIYDPDNNPNHVLEFKTPWKVEVNWNLKSDHPDLDITDGFWEVTCFVESIGTKTGGYEGEIGSAKLQFHKDALPTSTPWNYLWKVMVDVPVGKINLPGIYLMTTLIQFKSLNDTPKPMAGFSDHPLITFYEAH